MASGRPELVIKVPADLVRRCAGFSFDIGGSVMKVAYRSKADYDEAMRNQTDGAVATVRLVSFSRQELDDAIDFIKENCYITRVTGEETKVYTTGVGGYQFKAKMEEGLNVKNINIPEQDCILHSLRYLLKTMPREQLLQPFDKEATVKPMAEQTMLFNQVLEAMKKQQTNMSVPGLDLETATGESMLEGVVAGLNQPGNPAKPMTEQPKPVYPLAIGIFGSAFGLMRINEDGSYSSMDMSNRGGRAMLAMASLFLDCQDFNEFLDLARRGNPENVDWCLRNVISETSTEEAQSGANPDHSDDLYASFVEGAKDNNSLVFSFGQGVAKKKEDFKREDLAAALMRFYCNDLAQLVDMGLREEPHTDIKNIFFGGGFPGNELSRYWITRELTGRIGLKAISGNMAFEQYQIHFMKHGQHLGCIGGLINTVDHFIKPTPGP